MIVGLKRGELDRVEAQTLTADRALLRPKDAAALILYDPAGGRARFLLGKRRGDLKFMPGQFVFPGGRRERTDAGLRHEGSLRPRDEARLREGAGAGPARAHALALAAIREFHEETGMMIGRPEPAAALGFVPVLDGIAYVARAITPPGRVRRFDTRFFMAPVSVVGGTAPGGPPHPEFDELRWASAEETRDMDLPAITRTILDVALRSIAAEFSGSLPEFRMRHGRYVCEERS